MKPDDVSVNIGNVNWSQNLAKCKDPILMFKSIFDTYDRHKDGQLDEKDNLTKSEQSIVDFMKSRFFDICNQLGIQVNSFSINIINELLNPANFSGGLHSVIVDDIENNLAKPTIERYSLENEDVQLALKYLNENSVVNGEKPKEENLSAGEYGFTEGGKTNIYPNGIMTQGNEIRIPNGIITDKSGVIKYMPEASDKQ